jgi:N-acyl-D-amino-acid deacylase
MTERHEVLIRNAQVYDGTGRAPVEADVALDGARISELGTVRGEGRIEIDATGLAVAPGFIDVHTHDDFAAILHPDMGFKLTGGVTTCVVGNCGMGAAPHSAAVAMARAFHPNHALPVWDGYAGYLDRLEASPASVNIAALVGHGTLRLAALANPRNAPTGPEMQHMKDLLAEGLDAGAVGLSTGLIYEPGRHASTDEIVELACEMTGRKRLYATHMRNEGAKLLDSVAEAIEIGERAGVPVQISHHKASGRENWGRVAQSLALIEAAQTRGMAVQADQYPYTAGSTVLSAIAQNQGLARPDPADAGGGLGRTSAADVVVESTERHPEWEGRRIAEFADEWGIDGQAAAERILESEPMTTVVIHSMSEDDVQRVMRHPSTMIGSDGIPTLEGRPHPRLYGSFARVLGRYARELGLFPLAEAVHRMTGLAAATFRLTDRGEVRTGAFADLVVFDPETIIDRGTYEDPKQPPLGIRHVFVNGLHAVRDGLHTGARSGQVIRASD